MTLNDKKSDILIPQFIGGGDYLSQSTTNLERRNHGLSLLNQTVAHCISPSSYDTTTSLNDLNLQLHASSSIVSNPYSFSIKSNTMFSAVAQAALPTTDTILLKLNASSTNPTITIPDRVTVVKVDGNCYTYNDNYEEEPPVCALFNRSNNKNWLYSQGDGSTDSTIGRSYVGVTPNKSYNLGFIIINSGNIEISYSAEINTHTPDVKDY